MLVRGRPGDTLPAKHDELTAVARLLGYKPAGARPADRGPNGPPPGPTPRRRPWRRTTAAPPAAPARSWTASSTADRRYPARPGASAGRQARPLARSTRRASTVRKPRQSASAAGRPGRPVERPAAVVALRAGQVVQVRLDDGRVEQPAGHRARQRREVERRSAPRRRPPGRARPGRGTAAAARPARTPPRRGPGPAPAQEGQHAEHLVRRPARSAPVDPRPHDLVARLEPGVARGRGRTAARRSGRSGSARREPSAGTHQGRAAPRTRVGRTNGAPPSAGATVDQPVEGAADQPLVPRVGQVHDPQRHLDRGRLAGGRPAVRLERVPEPAVAFR